MKKLMLSLVLCSCFVGVPYDQSESPDKLDPAERIACAVEERGNIDRDRCPDKDNPREPKSPDKPCEPKDKEKSCEPRDPDKGKPDRKPDIDKGNKKERYA